MNLNEYKPTQGKFIVYECIGDPIKEISGILSGFLLALVNNYRFKINGLDKSPFAEVFASEIPWWETQWKDFGWKHGYLNLRNIQPSEIKFLENETLENKFFNTHILHFYSDSNVIPYILDNKIYVEKLEKLSIQKNSNIYKILFELLFGSIETEYSENFEFLLNNYKKYTNPVVIIVDETTELNEISHLKKHDFVYVYCENQVVYTKIKDSLSDMNFSRIKIQNVENDDFVKSNKISKLLEFKFLSNFPKTINFTKNHSFVFIEKLINQE